MSSEITPGLVLQFSDQFDYFFQQKYMRLRSHCMLRTGVIGTMAAFDVLGQSEMIEITGQRDTDTTWNNPASTRRWAPKMDFNHPVLLGWQESMEILTNLEMGYAENGAMAAARKADDILLEAAVATAAEGQTGTSTSAFVTTDPSGGGVAGGRVPSSSTGLTVAKMRLVRGYFNDREVGVDDVENGVQDAFVWVTNGTGMRQLMAETEATSSDYIGDNGQRMPLVNGMIPYYMGFRLRINNRLRTVSGETENLAWHKRAMGCAIWREKDLFMDRIPTKNNAQGVQYMMSMGAVRIQDNGVIAILNTTT